MIETKLPQRVPAADAVGVDPHNARGDVGLDIFYEDDGTGPDTYEDWKHISAAVFAARVSGESVVPRTLYPATKYNPLDASGFWDAYAVQTVGTEDDGIGSLALSLGPGDDLKQYPGPDGRMLPTLALGSLPLSLVAASELPTPAAQPYVARHAAPISWL